jgi:hypothetical protein
VRNERGRQSWRSAGVCGGGVDYGKESGGRAGEWTEGKRLSVGAAGGGVEQGGETVCTEKAKEAHGEKKQKA